MIEMELLDENGVKYDIIANFYLGETQKSYIVYTDRKMVDNRLNIYVIDYEDENLENYNYVEDESEVNLVVNKLKELGFEEVYNEKE